MQDQVGQLEEQKGIRAAYLNSTLSYSGTRIYRYNASVSGQGEVKLLYVWHLRHLVQRHEIRCCNA